MPVDEHNGATRGGPGPWPISSATANADQATNDQVATQATREDRRGPRRRPIDTTNMPQGPSSAHRVLRIGVLAVGVAATLLIVRVAPAVLIWLSFPALLVTAVSGLSVAAALKTPKRLDSMLLTHLSWLFNFVAAATLLGLSAGIAVAAQADWDAAEARGTEAQVHTLLNDIVQPISIAAVIGVLLVLARISFSLWRSGLKRRRKAAKRVQKVIFGRHDERVTGWLVKASAPGWTSISTLVLIVWIWTMLRSGTTSLGA